MGSSKDDRQTLMFSATFPDEVQNLATRLLRTEYLFIAVGMVGGANQDVTQTVLEVPSGDKVAKLKDYMANEIPQNRKVLIFVEMKKRADFLAARLCQDGYKCTSIHGDRMQREREIALNDFKVNRCNILMATSVAARGLDIPEVEYVINFDMPGEIDEYVHRIGRTGRLGKKGHAITFVDPSHDNQVLRSLVSVLKNADQEIPSWLEEHSTGAVGTMSEFNTNQGRSDFRTAFGGSGGGGFASASGANTNNTLGDFSSVW